ncbi:MAG TPA: patatin-like phospholipase family protein [Bryobacteraceae bacterium]|nr:patatin-like phospholipase family protein [Bryobacteraceae bacterium]
MPDADPVCLSKVLQEEYEALRADAPAYYKPVNPAADESTLLAELYQKVHGQTKPFTALCISGGGIRSATFALGAIQSMADHGYLDQFDYLSTVSGGGYIGSWLTAWIQRVGGMAKVAPCLKRTAKKPAPGDVDPIQHLRDYNNYLTPKLGMFSADTWTVTATVIRNMTLNWVVLVPLMLFALMIPRLFVPFMNAGSLMINSMGWTWLPRVTLYLGCALFSWAVFNTMRYLPGVGNARHTQGDFLRHILTPMVLAYILQCAEYSWVTDGTTFWREVGQGLVEAYAGWAAYLLYWLTRPNPKPKIKPLFGPISLVAMPLLGAGVGAFSWILLTQVWESDSVGLSQFVALGPPMLLLGFSLAGAFFVGLTSSVLKDEDREWFSRGGACLTLFILAWAGICSLVLLVPELTLAWKGWAQGVTTFLGGLSGWAGARAGYSPKSKATKDEAQPATTSWLVSLAIKLAPPIFLVLSAVGLSIFTDFLLVKTGLFADAQWWQHPQIVENSSLGVNAILAAGFLLLSLFASRYININMFSLNSMYRNRLIRAYLGASNPNRNASLFTGFAENDNLHMSEINTAYRPFHVLNLTLNLVAGERLAWQQRKAESFTVSPQHCGSLELGYRPSAQYGDAMTLGTAMAISGAAASPNMGYHSSPVVGFIMTLFNARLGAWLGNPGKYGAKTWKLRGPRSAVGSLVKEAFGLTNDRSEYVYLSDGGHFENLGLYEMVLRRCHIIVVLDSGADPNLTYEDLGNALRKIRIDMNIPIEFEQEMCCPLQERKKRCAVARIGYSKVDGDCDDGYLIYVKPLFLGNESPDVQSYHAEQPVFPQQSTTDQWFNESQTESYRMLGLETMDEIVRGLEGNALDDVRKVAEAYIKHNQ